MASESERQHVLEQLEACPLTGRALRSVAVRLLFQHLKGYDWVGIYRLEDGELVLDEFCGAPTEHTRIPVGRGVCGTAVAENRNQIVADVDALDNYLACSTETRSEIVVLIRRGDQVLGQIDVDGHEPGAFDESDEALLDAVARRLAEHWEEDAAGDEVVKAAAC
ncbi:MAG TPA: GAF domain-containing protein [Fimbriimonadaceae bacterium]|nr:GAF domain-containing protein [Fimbriimonadaceae bacterium]